MPDAFVARQPIFNHKLEVVGYELLFRGDGYAQDMARIANAERATATVVLNSLTELDLGRIVGAKPAWINVSREFVLGGLAEAIPAGLVGFDIQESELLDDAMIKVLRELKQQGYRLALDDYQGRSGSGALLGLFDLVKLNMLELGRKGVSQHIEDLHAYQGQVLVEKLSTRPDHEYCVSVGCHLFQGYFFCRPSMVCTRGIAANRLALLQVVAALQDPNVQLTDIEQLIARDVALSFRLLRYVNSAFFGLRGEVRSIGQALALLGIENVRRWATLSVLASIDDKPAELTTTALIRARFCELAGERRGNPRPAELFTLGLFSVIDAMMDSPMQDVVESLPFADDMREALVYRRGDWGQLLDCVVALESGEDSPARATVPGAGELYLEALMWANGAAESLFGEGDGENAAAKLTAPPRVDPRAALLSKPPPGMPAPSAPTPVPAPAGAAASVPAAPAEPAGLFARAKAWFGRRFRGHAPVPPPAEPAPAPAADAPLKAA